MLVYDKEQVAIVQPQIKESKIKKVLLTQPNYSWFGGRAWKISPYSLGVLNACVKRYFETELLDPIFKNMSMDDVGDYLRKFSPDVVCISTISPQSLKHIRFMIKLIKKNLPNCIIVMGGVLPTTVLNIAMKIENVDYWIIGEGEFKFVNLLKELNKPNPDLSSIDGLAYYKDGIPYVNPSKEFIQDLDSIPFADYGNLDILEYGNTLLKYSLQLVPRQFPYAITSTSRGCVYRCSFCAVPKTSGGTVRMRSAENVLKEIDELYRKGIREVIFLDDHFLFSKERIIKICEGLIERNYDLTWKCTNLTGWLLDEELIDMMWKSKCYQVTISIESGNQDVLYKLVRKPINLNKVPPIIDRLKKRNFEIIANFVIGFPQETWDQIRDTIAYAEKLNVDLVNFHIATPLPNTELTEIAIKGGFIPSNVFESEDMFGYCEGAISTKEFTPQELQILRAFEWDRINFKTEEKKKTIARMQGINLEELEEWRRETRQKLGVVNKP